jgi:hypothetical protein
MKSIAWAIVLAGIFISSALESMAKPDRKFTSLEGYVTLFSVFGFLFSLPL